MLVFFRRLFVYFVPFFEILRFKCNLFLSNQSCCFFSVECGFGIQSSAEKSSQVQVHSSSNLFSGVCGGPLHKCLSELNKNGEEKKHSLYCLAVDVIGPRPPTSDL